MHKQVIVLRKDLKMRLGKCVAQGAHASMGALLQKSKVDDDYTYIPMDTHIQPWLDESFTKICCYVNSEQELEELCKIARALHIPWCLITDSGKTEFNNVPTVTCCAIGPAHEEMINRITGHLPLY